MYIIKIEEKYFNKIMEILKFAKSINEVTGNEDKILDQTIAICYQEFYKNERELSHKQDNKKEAE